MKKIVIITIILMLTVWQNIYAGKPPSIPVPQPCTGYELRNDFVLGFSGIAIYGTQYTGFYALYSWDEVVNKGYTITVSVKTETSAACTYSGSTEISQGQNRSFVSGNTISNIYLPSTSPYTLTVTVDNKSNCVYDSWLGLYVYYKWTNSYKSTDRNGLPPNSFPMYPQENVCPNQGNGTTLPNPHGNSMFQYYYNCSHGAVL
ncbi:MAG: hypothetical protein FWD66_01370 [Paludibacter sp.]|nr:hypothetical protein [Paludibacter sp.]